MIIETKYDIGDVVRFEYYHKGIIAGEIIGISIIPY